MFRLIAIAAAATVLLAACPKQEPARGPSPQETAGIRARSADAFAEVNAAERGEPPPPPKAQPAEVEEKPEELPPPPPKREIAKKPAEAVPVNPARSAPAWTSSQPNQPGYWVGIGVALSRGNEAEDWGRARDAAYVELASTLKVKIKSVISDYFKEKNMKLYKGDNVAADNSETKSAYEQDTSFFVDATLEGVEIADRWKDAGQKKYWMLVRLSQAEVSRRIQERLDRARKKALDYVQAALQAEQAGKLAESLKGLFKSYLALREYFGGVVEVDLNNDRQPEVLNHEIERSVDRIVSDLEWQVEKPALKAVNGGGLDEAIGVNLRYKGQPVVAMPVSFAFQRGKGSVEGHVSSDQDGRAQARVVKVFGEKTAIIGARVDVAALTDDPAEAIIVEAKFGKGIERKTGKFTIDLEELSAFVSIEEEVLGQAVERSALAADMKDILHRELGLVFTDSGRGADLEISGKATVQSCAVFFNQRQCTALIQLTVTDRAKSRQLFSKKLDANGNGENDQEAGRAALNALGKRVAKSVIESMK